MNFITRFVDYLNDLLSQSDAIQNLNFRFAKWQFRSSSAKRIRIWKKMATMLKNGVKINDALLELYKRNLDAKGPNDSTTIALGHWVESIQSAKLSTAIEGWIEHDEWMLITAGFESGFPEKSLLDVIHVMQAKKKIRGAVVSGTFYPVALLLMFSIVLYVFGSLIIPQITNIAPNAHWTGQAYFLDQVSKFVMSYGAYSAAAVLTIIFVFFWSLPRRLNDSFRVKLDRTGPYAIYRILQGTSFLIAFSAMIDAGIKVESVLHRLSENANPYLKKRITAILPFIGSANVGESMSKTGLEFPDREIIDDLIIYSQYAGFEKALKSIATEWLESSIEDINIKMKVVFYIGLFIIGLGFGTLVSGVFEMSHQLQSILSQGS